MDKTLQALLTAWWADGSPDAARVAADALIESGDLPDQLRDLPALELADLLQRFRAETMTMSVMFSEAAKRRSGVVSIEDALRGVAGVSATVTAKIGRASCRE